MNKILGRLIFFLYPDKKNIKLIKNIFMNEFEIYPVYNHDKLYNLLEEFTSSIIFINIDFNKKFNMKKFIQKILENETLNEVSINIITSNKKIEITSFNIDNIFLLNDKKDIKNIILKYLENNYAKGMRKYIRVELDNENKIEFTIKTNDKIDKGYITNINSSAGVFNFTNKSIQLEIGRQLADIELKIIGISYFLSGTVLKSIDSFDENLYIIVFDREKMNDNEISGIQNYIYNIMQKMMKKKIENI
jgi:hypothetical protein